MLTTWHSSGVLPHIFLLTGVHCSCVLLAYSNCFLCVGLDFLLQQFQAVKLLWNWCFLKNSFLSLTEASVNLSTLECNANLQLFLKNAAYLALLSTDYIISRKETKPSSHMESRSPNTYLALTIPHNMRAICLVHALRHAHWSLEHCRAGRLLLNSRIVWL